MRGVLLLGTAWASLCCSLAGAQTWVDQVLPERSYDFGTVARGSKIRHSFRLINRLDQEIHIADTRTKCGCTDVRIGARSIPPGTQTTIEAVIDTTKFVGIKKSGLTLVIDRPTVVEVDLDTVCFIRGDITLTPGGIDFGIVNRSAGVKPTLTLSLAYAGGQPGWGVTQMKTRTGSISAKLLEQGRSASGQVQYVLNATLDPRELTGFFKDEVTLYTNDPSGPTIPISVTATVQSAMTVSPSPLILGSLKAGQVVTKKLLVRAPKPFKVTGVKPNKDDLTSSPDPNESRPLHTVDLTFTAPTQPGPYNAVVEIASDLQDEPPAKVVLFATVVP